jgi:hypothetical protein
MASTIKNPSAYKKKKLLNDSEFVGIFGLQGAGSPLLPQSMLQLVGMHVEADGCLKINA